MVPTYPIIIGNAIVSTNSSNRLFTSNATLNPLLLNSNEIDRGQTKTPNKLVETESNKAKAKLPPHYNSHNYNSIYLIS